MIRKDALAFHECVEKELASKLGAPPPCARWQACVKLGGALLEMVEPDLSQTVSTFLLCLSVVVAARSTVFEFE
jgi:hypothetical protein